MKSKHLLFFLIVLLSEAKALFYNSDLRVSWYLFSDNERYLCNVVEDYSNILVFAIIFFYFAFLKIDFLTRKFCLYLFVLSLLDLIHLGLMDMLYLIPIKLLIAYLICSMLNKYLRF